MIADEERKNMDLKVKIKKHVPDLILPEQKEYGAWIDLRAAEDVTLKSGEFKIISLGISMQIPKDCEALVVPRSSTFKKWGIIQTNSIGVIDPSYCGNNDIWGMPVLAMRDTEIKKNDRICQFRLIKSQDQIAFSETDDLGNADRGGFGSTGTK